MKYYISDNEIKFFIIVSIITRLSKQILSADKDKFWCFALTFKIFSIINWEPITTKK